MSLRRSVISRIDKSLDEEIRNLSRKNGISAVQASKTIANQIKKMKLRERLIREEIKF